MKNTHTPCHFNCDYGTAKASERPGAQAAGLVQDAKEGKAPSAATGCTTTETYRHGRHRLGTDHIYRPGICCIDITAILGIHQQMTKLKATGGQKFTGHPDQDDKGSIEASLQCLITFVLICTTFISTPIIIYCILT
jgi:hypothetical protein